MEQLIFKRLIEIQRDITAISKNKGGQGSGINYKFRGIDDMYNAIHPLHKKYGVFIMPQVLDSIREERKTKAGGNLVFSIIDIKYIFYAEDGSNVEAIVRGEAMDTSDKATNKAMSVALKYALMQIYLIPTEEVEDLDPDGTRHENTSKVVDFDVIVKLASECVNRKELIELNEGFSYLYNNDEYTKIINERKKQLQEDKSW